jgi:uncharacterized protein YgiB involved in biofilm formation
MNGLGTLGVCTTILSAVAGALITPMLYFANEHEHAYKKLLTDLDSGQLVTFKSLEECAARGIPSAQCTASQNSAFAWAQGSGTSVSYDSLEACSQNHQSDNCPATTTSRPVAKIYISTTSYDPPMIAWQAAANDLSKAVPLYPSTEKNTAIRYDGKKFALGE